MSEAGLLQHYFAPLAALLAPEDVLELVVNRPGEVGVERRGGWTWHELPELTLPWLTTFATAAAAYTRQDIGAAHPVCATSLLGGERCQIVLSPAVAADTLCLALRKPARIGVDLAELAAGGLFAAVSTDEMVPNPVDEALLALKAAADWPGFLRLAVRSRKTILVSGATGSGKTTLAKALIALIPPDERLVTLEDTREFTAPHRNIVHLVYAKDGQGVSGLGPKALLEASLRLRPDRVMLQELRDEAAFYYLRSVCSGHPGSITTVHADSPALAFEQLGLLIRESEGGRDLGRDEIRTLLTLLVDVVVQTRRAEGRFRVTEIYFDPHRKRTADRGLRAP